MSLESFLIRGDKRVSDKHVAPVDGIASRLNPIDKQEQEVGKKDKVVEPEPRISIEECLVCVQKLRRYELQQKEPDYEFLLALDRYECVLYSRKFAERIKMQASSNVEAPRL
ncbi:hypothetical protein E4U09_000012 [Claviceps aff. purpurea]|uniref:Uncharacterized protein n=1 Tax=Claviceps aff. purpurea TaxID=1967640 RepID=A0A9P7U325_9HYPO|nr:hypothetical protein E4U09_000012 [Claviceps aff. purpurea]